MNRRVDIQDHRLAFGIVSPYPLPDCGHRPGQGLQQPLIRAGEGPVQGRVRRHPTEQSPLGTQRLDVSASLPTPGEDQHQMNQQPPPIMNHTRRTERF